MSVRASASLVLVLGLALAATGCVSSGGMRPPVPAAEPTHKADTYVAAGDFRVSSAFSSEFNEAQQSEYKQHARLAYRKAIEVDAKHLPAHIGLARLENRCGDHAAAETAYQKALAEAPRNAGLWSELGQVQLRQKQWQAAGASLQKALELDPLNKDYMTKLSFTLVLAGRKADAVAVMSKLHGEAKACVEIARACYRLRQADEGAQLLVRAEQLDPTSQDVMRAREELGAVTQAAYTAPAPAQAPPAVKPTPASAVERPMPADGAIAMPRPPVITIHKTKG